MKILTTFSLLSIVITSSYAQYAFNPFTRYLYTNYSEDPGAEVRASTETMSLVKVIADTQWYECEFKSYKAYDRKVYYFDSQSQSELLMYDFNLSDRDTLVLDGEKWPGWDTIVIDSVRTIYLENKAYTGQYVHLKSFNTQVVFVEHIGCLEYGLDYWTSLPYWDGKVLHAVCSGQSADTVLLYKRDYYTYGCNFTPFIKYYGLGKLISTSTFAECFPTPANDYLNIQSTRDAGYQLYNTLGEVLWSGKVNAGSIEIINTSGYSKGVYFIVFSDGNNQQVIKIALH